MKTNFKKKKSLYGEIVTRARTAIDLKLAEQIKPAQVFIKKITKRIY